MVCTTGQLGQAAGCCRERLGLTHGQSLLSPGRRLETPVRARFSPVTQLLSCAGHVVAQCLKRRSLGTRCARALKSGSPDVCRVRGSLLLPLPRAFSPRLAFLPADSWSSPPGSGWALLSGAWLTALASSQATPARGPVWPHVAEGCLAPGLCICSPTPLACVPSCHSLPSSH